MNKSKAELSLQQHLQECCVDTTMDPRPDDIIYRQLVEDGVIPPIGEIVMASHLEYDPGSMSPEQKINC